MSNIELPDSLYTLPDFVTNSDLRELYEVIIARMREEVAHVKLNTIQQLLVERIAYNYIVLRWREVQTSKNLTAGFEHSKYAKDYNTFWLDMTREFNRLVKGDDEDSTKRELVDKIGQAISSAFDGLHPDVANPLKVRLAEAFQTVGL